MHQKRQISLPVGYAEVKFDAFGTSKHEELKSLSKILFCYTYQYIGEI